MNNETDKILNINECAKLLHISVSMLRKLIYEKEICTFTIGNRYYFREADINRWIDEKIKEEF